MSEDEHQNNIDILLAPLQTGLIVEELTEHLLSLMYLHRQGEDRQEQIKQCEESIAYYKTQYRTICN